MSEQVEARRVLPPEQHQLELALDDVRRRIPWAGRSPRGLTRSASLFIFEPSGKKKRERIRDPSQLELFARAVEGPPVYGGAPSLLPFKWEV